MAAPQNQGMMQLTGISSQERARLCRGKRPLEESGAHDREPKGKKRCTHTLSSVILDVLRTNGLQAPRPVLDRICSILQVVVCKEVRKGIERALASLEPAVALGARLPIHSHSRNLRLRIINEVIQPLYTGKEVKGKQGSPIFVRLEDASTGTVVTTGPEASAELEVVVLEDFSKGNEEDWSEDEFKRHEIKGRDEKPPLISGKLKFKLLKGVGTLGEFKFTDNSSWTRKKKFELGVKVTDGFSEGPRIREAKTEPFKVKERRGELYQKCERPELNDEVWRLVGIRKDGPYHRKLSDQGVSTVGDFLRLYEEDEQALKTILGSPMSVRKWERIVKHAQKVRADKVGKIAHEQQPENVVEHAGKEPEDGMHCRNTGNFSVDGPMETNQGCGGSNILSGSNTHQTAMHMQEASLAIRTAAVEERPHAAAATGPSITGGGTEMQHVMDHQHTLEIRASASDINNNFLLNICSLDDTTMIPGSPHMQLGGLHTHPVVGWSTDAGNPGKGSKIRMGYVGWLKVKVALCWARNLGAAKKTKEFWERVQRSPSQEMIDCIIISS